MNHGPDDLLADLVQALLDEESARGSAREARSRQAEALRGLRAAGVRLGVVAHRIARARGVVLPIGERLRLAERLRKRVARQGSPKRAQRGKADGTLAVPGVLLPGEIPREPS